MSEQHQEEQNNTPQRSKLLFALAVLVVLVVVVIYIFATQSATQEPENEVVEVATEPQKPMQPAQVEPEQEPEPEPEPISEPVTLPAELPEEPVEQEQPEPLPELDNSDSDVQARLDSSLSQTSADLMVNDDLIRRAVVFVNNLADGEVATNHSPVAKPEQPFSVTQGDVLTMDPQSFERYDPYVAILTSLNTEQLVALYQRYQPLIEQAYGEVGNPNSSFEERLVQSIDLLLETPEMKTQVPLLRDSVTYKYAYSEWENLPPAQKQLLRMGPENVSKVKAVLKNLRAELESGM